MDIINTPRAAIVPARIAWLASFYNRLVDAIIANYKFRSTRKALSNLSERELTDIGIAKDEINAVSRRVAK